MIFIGSNNTYLHINNKNKNKNSYRIYPFIMHIFFRWKSSKIWDAYYTRNPLF